MIKPPYQEGIAESVKNKAKAFYEKICIVLHPFMPFITEEIWHILKDRNDGEDCIISTYPKAGSSDKNNIKIVEQAKDIISNIRDIRAKNGLSKIEPLDLVAIQTDRMESLLSNSGIQEMIVKVGVLNEIKMTAEEVSGSSFISGTEKFIVVFEKKIDVEAELEKLEKDLEYQVGFVSSIQKKMSNERFVNNAPEAVVSNERKKLADGEARIKMLKEEIERMKG
jgi:valyl-tRNA synthetase